MLRHLHSTAASVALCVVSLTAGGAAQTSRSLGVDEALGTLAFAGRMPIDLSPDGEWVAYALEDPSRHESQPDPRYRSYSPTGAYQEAIGCDVWITNVKTGDSQNLTGGKGSSWGPVWSPDGSRLAFYSDRSGIARLWVWDRTSATLREIPDLIVRPYFGFASVRWTADSRRVLLKVLPEGMTVEEAAELEAERPASPSQTPPGVTARVYEYEAFPSPDAVEATPWTARYLSDLALVDVSTGSVTRVARKTRAIGYWIAPDMSHVAYTSHVGMYPNTQDMFYDLVVVSLTDGTTRVVAPRVLMQYAVTVSWSPASDALAYTTTASQRGATGEAFVVPVRPAGPPRQVSSGQHPNFGAAYRAPQWDDEGAALYLPAGDSLWRIEVAAGKTEPLVTLPDRTVVDIVAPGNNIGRFWSPDGGRSLYVVTRNMETKRAGFARVDLSERRAAQVLEEEKYYGRDFLFFSDVSSDGRTLVYVAQDARHPDDLWVTDPSFREPRRLTHINPTLDDLSLGGSRLISWQTAEGKTLRGALFLPADYESGRRYPLVIRAYAGSMLSDGVYRFGGHGSGVDNMHLLTSRGYAVLMPDIPLRVGTPMSDIAAAVGPALDKVVELGLADPNRLGAFGHSYGGYTTLSLITQIPRFRAAVSSAGISNLVSNYGAMAADGSAGTIGWSETGQGRMGGHPWQVRDRYIENSPWFFLDRVQTPLLMVHGGLDRPSRPEEVFVGLRRLEKRVTYVRYEGEGHWQGTWGRANVADYWTRVIAWFDRYLKANGPATAYEE